MADYKQPKQMTPAKITPDVPGLAISELDMSVGNIERGIGSKETVKTSGIKIRGTGAATKGTMARGPMA